MKQRDESSFAHWPQWLQWKQAGRGAEWVEGPFPGLVLLDLARVLAQEKNERPKQSPFACVRQSLGENRAKHNVSPRMQAEQSPPC